MSKNKNDDHARLKELLESELDAYEQLLILAEAQAKLLAKDDIDAFDKSLDEGQKFIEKINGLHQESKALMQSYMSAPAGEKDADIDSLAVKIRGVLKECAGLNVKNAASAQERIEGYTEKIDKLSASRKGIGGYAQSVPNTPEMFDRKS